MIFGVVDGGSGLGWVRLGGWVGRESGLPGTRLPLGCEVRRGEVRL